MNICKECRFYVFDNNAYGPEHAHLCSRYSTENIDIVTGKKIVSGNTSCYNERDKTGRCGPNGINFNKKVTFLG